MDDMKDEMKELNAYLKESRDHVKKHRRQDLQKFDAKVKRQKNRIKKYKHDALTMEG